MQPEQLRSGPRQILERKNRRRRRPHAVGSSKFGELSKQLLLGRHIFRDGFNDQIAKIKILQLGRNSDGPRQLVRGLRGELAGVNKLGPKAPHRRHTARELVFTWIANNHAITM